MKSFTKFFLLIPALTFLFALQANAQVEPTSVYQNWYTIDKGDIMFDVAWRVVACDQENFILFSAFNELPEDRTMAFTATIKNPATGAQFDFEFSQAMPKNENWIADCSGDFHPELRVAIPAGYDPNTLEVTIQF